MGPSFPWEVPKIIENYFLGPCLFLVLYRFYESTNLRQGSHLSTKYLKDKELHKQIDQLNLDIRRIISSKIWNNGKPFKDAVIRKR